MIPPITPLVDDATRPVWSVMIPTYEPDLRLLDLTVSSVLEQDPGDSRMQIEIVDDCSSSFDPHEYARHTADGRITCFRHAAPVGMTPNWNSCISRSRGRWVHILHQDDLVHPGFYERLEYGIKSEPSIGAAACEHYMIDGEGRELFKVARVDASGAGILTSWHRHFFEQLSFMTPAIVVSRAVYEKLGGFDEEFSYAADWDMWKRVAARFPVWYEPRPLASYRRHDAAATVSLRESGHSIREIRKSIDRSEGYLEQGLGHRLADAARRHYTKFALRLGLNLVRQGNWGAAFQHIVEARRMTGWSGVGRCSLALGIDLIRRRLAGST